MSEKGRKNGFKILSICAQLVMSVMLIASLLYHLADEGLSTFLGYEIMMLIVVLYCIIALFSIFKGKSVAILIVGAVIYFVIGTLDWYFPGGITISLVHIPAEELVIARWFVILAVGNIVTAVLTYLRKKKEEYILDIYGIVLIVIYAVAFIGLLIFMGYPTLSFPAPDIYI